jgi:hypothetical protein
VATVLKFKPRKTPLELNTALIHDLTVKRIHHKAEARALDRAIAGAYLEQEKLVRELRRRG